MLGFDKGTLEAQQACADEPGSDTSNWLLETEIQEAAATRIMGSAVEEVSVVEYVNLDHMYYRTAPVTDTEERSDDVVEDLVDDVESVVTVTTTPQSSESGTIIEELSSVQSCFTEESSASDAVLPDDLDLSVLTENDLLELSKNLEQLIECDTISEISEMQLAVETIPQSNCKPCVPIEKVETQSTEKAWPLRTYEEFAVEQPILPFDDYYSPVPSWSSPLSCSENNSTGIGSPLSDFSQDNDYHWEESFTELFPALV